MPASELLQTAPQRPPMPTSTLTQRQQEPATQSLMPPPGPAAMTVRVPPAPPLPTILPPLPIPEPAPASQMPRSSPSQSPSPAAATPPAPPSPALVLAPLPAAPAESQRTMSIPMQIMRGSHSGGSPADGGRRQQSVRGGIPVLPVSPLFAAAAGTGRDGGRPASQSTTTRALADSASVQELLHRIASDREHHAPPPGASQAAVLASLDSMAPRLVAFKAAQATIAAAAASQRVSQRALGWRQTVGAVSVAVNSVPPPRLAAPGAAPAGTGAGVPNGTAANTVNPLVERAMRQLDQGGAAASSRRGGLAQPARRAGP